MRCRTGLVLTAVALLCGCAGTYSLVQPGDIDVDGLTVRAAGAWNRASRSASGELRKGAQLWTRDGPLLDRLLLIPGVPDGEALFVDRDKTAALPVFRADMLPNDLEELTESSIVKYVGEGSAAVNTARLRPHRFGDHRGVLFELDVAVSNNPDYRGMAGAFVANGELYLLVYLAAEPYYFGKHLADAEAVIKSARLASTG